MAKCPARTEDMALGKVVCVSERAGGKNVLGMRHEIKPTHTLELRISIRLHSQPPRSSFFHLRPALCAPYEYRTVCRMPSNTTNSEHARYLLTAVIDERGRSQELPKPKISFFSARDLAQLADQLPTELCIRVRIEFGLKARTIAYLTALRFPPSKVCFSRHLLVLVNRTHQAG